MRKKRKTYIWVPQDEMIKKKKKSKKKKKKKWSFCSLITTKWVSQFSKTGQLTETIFIGKWGLFHSSSRIIVYYQFWLGRSAFVSYPWLHSTWREHWYTNPLSLCPLVCSFISEYMTRFILNHTFRRNSVWVPFFLFGNHTADVLGIMHSVLSASKDQPPGREPGALLADCLGLRMMCEMGGGNLSKYKIYS